MRGWLTFIDGEVSFYVQMGIVAMVRLYNYSWQAFDLTQTDDSVSGVYHPYFLGKYGSSDQAKSAVERRFGAGKPPEKPNQPITGNTDGVSPR